MKRTTAALLIAALGFAGSGCGATESGEDSGNGKKARNSKPVQVQAQKILKEFEENEAAADGKYKNKTLQVAGVVDKIDTEFLDDEQYVVNVGTGSDFELTTVNCDDQTSKNVASLKKGQKITVVGDFEDGGDLGVELENCSIK